MELLKVIQKLREERDRIGRVISALEELAQDGSQRLLNQPKRRGRKGMGLQERQEVSRRMKKYWANRRKEVGDTTHE